MNAMFSGWSNKRRLYKSNIGLSTTGWALTKPEPVSRLGLMVQEIDASGTQKGRTRP